MKEFIVTDTHSVDNLVLVQYTHVYIFLSSIFFFKNVKQTMNFVFLSFFTYHLCTFVFTLFIISFRLFKLLKHI